MNDEGNEMKNPKYENTRLDIKGHWHFHSWSEDPDQAKIFHATEIRNEPGKAARTICREPHRMRAHSELNPGEKATEGA